MSDDADHMNREPWWSVADHLDAIATKLYELTGRKCITRLGITSEVGPSLGILPGTSIDVQTSVGPVEIYVETVPRQRATIQLPAHQDSARPMSGETPT